MLLEYETSRRRSRHREKRVPRGSRYMKQPLGPQHAAALQAAAACTSVEFPSNLLSAFLICFAWLFRLRGLPRLANRIRGQGALAPETSTTEPDCLIASS